MASLYFKYAAMNSGKSTQLLQAHYNYAERGMNPVALTAKIDGRYGHGKITARIGLSLDAQLFDDTTDIFALIENQHRQQKIHAVLVDEAQFLTEAQVAQCAKIVDDLGIPVMCYGLRTDFMGKLFTGSEALMRLADNLEEIKTICWCGKKATQTARIGTQGIVRAGDQIAIGGNDMYVALCRKHFMRGDTGAKTAPAAAQKGVA
jgi:thymidine kinase